MKYFLACLLTLLLVVPTSLRAADENVWFTPIPSETPSQLNPGDPILIYAKINNVIADPVTYVLAFTAGDKTIGTKVVTIAGYTGQDVSVQWTMPEVSTPVSATVAKATDKTKKELKALIGPIGSVTVGVAPKEIDIGPIKGWVGDMVSDLERFRLRQLKYFTARKELANEVLSRTTIKDVQDLLQPEPSVETATVSEVKVEKKDNGTTVGYLKLMYATIGKAFFAHKAVYFVAIILLGLVVIRLFFKLLFR